MLLTPIMAKDFINKNNLLKQQPINMEISILMDMSTKLEHHIDIQTYQLYTRMVKKINIPSINKMIIIDISFKIYLLIRF